MPRLLLHLQLGLLTAWGEVSHLSLTFSKVVLSAVLHETRGPKKQ